MNKNRLNTNISLFQNAVFSNYPKTVNLLDTLKNGLNQNFVIHDKAFGDGRVSAKYYNEFKKFDGMNLNTVIGYFRDEIEKQGKTEKLAEFKKLFPALTISGEFVRRANDALINHSGLIALDFDNIPADQISEVKTEIAKLDFVAYVGLSISGTGFYVIIPIPKHENNESHRKSFYALEKFFFEKYGLKADDCKDVARLRFYANDSNAYINETAQSFSEMIEKSIFEPERKPKKLVLPNDLHPYIKKAIQNIFEQTDEKIQSAPDKAITLFNQSVLLGGYVAGGYISESEAETHLYNSISQRNIRSIGQALQIIKNGLQKGIAKPLSIEIPEPTPRQATPQPKPKKAYTVSSFDTSKNVHFENSLLCFVLRFSDLFDELSDKINGFQFDAEIFHDKTNYILAQHIQKLFLDGTLINSDTLHISLERAKQTELLSKVESLRNYVQDSDKLRNHKDLAVNFYSFLKDNHLKQSVKNLASKVIDSDLETGQELSDFLINQAFEISAKSEQKEIQHIKDSVNESISEIKNRSEQDGNITGVPTGLHELDKITAGWQKSDLIILAARPAMGKTSFSLTALRNAAIDYNVPTAFFSLEMSNVQLTTRLLSSESEIESQKLKTGDLNVSDWDKLNKSAEILRNGNVFLDDTAGLDIHILCSKARKLKKQHDIQLIIVDYLQLASAKISGNREREISHITQMLKRLAKELSVPVIALSQLSRAVETRGGDKRPQLSDLRESGSIEQEADIVLFLYRPEYYEITEDADGKSTQGIGEVIIAKHRNGSLGTVQLKFDGKFTRFTNLGDTPNANNAPNPEIIQAENNYTNSPSFQTQDNDFEDGMSYETPF